jgi:hypothetical protein
MRSMTSPPWAQVLAGRVVVVAGEDPLLAEVATAVTAVEAHVAVVSRSLPSEVPAAVRFRSDPGDSTVWERVAMHVEQHLGPVDGVVADVTAAAVVESVFDVDLARRRRPGVVVVDAVQGVADVLSRLAGTP